MWFYIFFIFLRFADFLFNTFSVDLGDGKSCIRYAYSTRFTAKFLCKGCTILGIATDFDVAFSLKFKNKPQNPIWVWWFGTKISKWKKPWNLLMTNVSQSFKLFSATIMNHPWWFECFFSTVKVQTIFFLLLLESNKNTLYACMQTKPNGVFNTLTHQQHLNQQYELCVDRYLH